MLCNDCGVQDHTPCIGSTLAHCCGLFAVAVGAQVYSAKCWRWSSDCFPGFPITPPAQPTTPTAITSSIYNPIVVEAFNISEIDIQQHPLMFGLHDLVKDEPQCPSIRPQGIKRLQLHTLNNMLRPQQTLNGTLWK